MMAPCCAAIEFVMHRGSYLRVRIYIFIAIPNKVQYFYLVSKTGSQLNICRENDQPALGINMEEQTVTANRSNT